MFLKFWNYVSLVEFRYASGKFISQGFFLKFTGCFLDVPRMS